MSGICNYPGCPCQLPAEDDEERPVLPPRLRVGRPMPAGFRERVWADLKHRREQKGQGQA